MLSFGHLMILEMLSPEGKKHLISLNKTQEKEWWHLLKAGDKDVLSKIYSAFVGDMFGYGMSIVADREMIKDCIQEVFIDLWKYRSNLSNTDNIKLYLFKSLRNKIYNQTKKENKNKELGEQDRAAAIMPSYEDVLVNDQRNAAAQQKIAVAMEELPQRQREVIRHIYFENHSYEEISNLMGINIRSVYTLAWKALSALRKSISPINTLLVLYVSSQFL